MQKTAVQETEAQKKEEKDIGDPNYAYEECLLALKRRLEQADAVVIGAGSGLSAAAGLTYAGRRFEDHFKEFIERYGMRDMYSAGFYPFPTQEEKWAYWSRHIYYNRYDMPAAKLYRDLYGIMKDKNHFVLTTNVDHQFQLAGFDKQRLFYTQGDYGLWQCSKPCHQETYDNEETVRKMFAEQRDMRIPTELVPRCPRCGRPMAMNLRCDDTFVQDAGWYAAARRYEDFLRRHRGRRLLFLELGVGGNTPGIIKYPFWKMTLENRSAAYACINQKESYIPPEIRGRSVCIPADIGHILKRLTLLEH